MQLASAAMTIATSGLVASVTLLLGLFLTTGWQQMMMLVQGMLSQASPEVRKQMEQGL